MKNFFHYLFIFVFGAYGFLGSTASLFGTTLIKMKEWLSNVLKSDDSNLILKYSEYVFIFLIDNNQSIFIIVLTSSILLFIMKRYDIFNSNSCVRISMRYFIKLILPKTLYNLVFEIHEFQHMMEITSYKIRNIKHEDKLALSNFYEERIDKLLLQCAKIISQVSTDEISINIKLFENIKGNSNYYKNAVLVTDRRIPSKSEMLKFRNEELRARVTSEQFKLVDILDSTALEDCAKSNKKYSYNLAYNYVFFNKAQRYWICNNLAKAVNKKEFFSSSKDYNKYYNSLAVFLLSSKQINENVNDNVIGLFIIDSIKKQVFEKIIIGRVGGYLAHRLFEFISLYRELHEKQE